MNTLTVKIPSALDQALDALAERTHQNRSELVRQAIWTFIEQQGSGAPQGLLGQIPDLVGCFSGGPVDLSSNPSHLADFGRV